MFRSASSAPPNPTAPPVAASFSWAICRCFRQDGCRGNPPPNQITNRPEPLECGGPAAAFAQAVRAAQQPRNSTPHQKNLSSRAQRGTCWNTNPSRAFAVRGRSLISHEINSRAQRIPLRRANRVASHDAVRAPAAHATTASAPRKNLIRRLLLRRNRRSSRKVRFGGRHNDTPGWAITPLPTSNLMYLWPYFRAHGGSGPLGYKH